MCCAGVVAFCVEGVAQAVIGCVQRPARLSAAKGKTL